MDSLKGTNTISSRAATLTRPREMAVVSCRIPAPAADEVRVRLEGCGVCASNLPVWEGRPWFEYPLVPGAPGHEGWGTIEAVGTEVSGFDIGDRVAMVSARAYAEYDLAQVDAVVKLPTALDGRDFPGEPLGCAMNIFRRSEIAAGQTVAIVGAGFLGALLTALARQAGARVIALSRRPFALEIAERFGASTVVSLEDPARALRQVRNAIGPEGCERVIEAVGSQETLDLATELTGIRARLVIAGYHQEGPRRINLQQWNWRGLDVINAHERDPEQYRLGMQEAAEWVASGRLDPSALYTHRFPLSEANAAFDTLARRPPGFLKALLICD